jgi:hypothetical protein
MTIHNVSFIEGHLKAILSLIQLLATKGYKYSPNREYKWH